MCFPRRGLQFSGGGLMQRSFPGDSRPLLGALVSVSNLQGEKSLLESGLDSITECNCVAAKRGGKQQEVNRQSVG